MIILNFSESVEALLPQGELVIGVTLPRLDHSLAFPIPAEESVYLPANSQPVYNIIIKPDLFTEFYIVYV